MYYGISVKTFECLFAKRYILCFTKDWATAILIRKTRYCIVVNSYDVGEIKDAVKKFYLLWKYMKSFVLFLILVFKRRE